MRAEATVKREKRKPSAPLSPNQHKNRQHIERDGHKQARRFHPSASLACQSATASDIGRPSPCAKPQPVIPLIMQRRAE